MLRPRGNNRYRVIGDAYVHAVENVEENLLVGEEELLQDVVLI